MSGRDPSLYPVVPWVAYTPIGACVVYARSENAVTSFIYNAYGFMNGSVQVVGLTPDQAYESIQQGLPSFRAN